MDTPTHNIQPGCFGGFFARRTRKKPPTHASALQGSSQGLSHGDNLKTTRAAEKKVGDLFLVRRGFLTVRDIPQEDQYYGAFHNFSYGNQGEWWTAGHHEQLPPYLSKADVSARSGDISSLIEQSLDKINGKLRELSLKIHGNYISFQFYNSTTDSILEYRSSRDKLRGKVGSVAMSLPPENPPYTRNSIGSPMIS